MKLTHDCIRDILLFSENLSYSEPAINDKIFKSDLLKKYTSDEINYAIEKLGKNDAQLIVSDVFYASDEPCRTVIYSLTFKGHKYLDNIRDPKIWNTSKKISSKLASVSIDIMSEIV